MKLEVVDLQKSFDNKEILKNINFTFEQGKIYGLLGRNGAGKTTFFNCLNDDVTPDKGTFYVLSTPVVPEFLTGREFLKFFLEINEEKIKDAKTIDEYFDFMKIDEKDRDKLLKDYSHGMKNKMQMLINIIANPNILLLDEPLTSLDVIVAEEMKEMLKSIKKDHILIFSTHIMDLALSLCDEIVILKNGCLTLVDSKIKGEEKKEKIIEMLREGN